MADRLFGTIETQIQENVDIVTQINDGGINLVSYYNDTPQIQTQITTGAQPIVTVINAPFVEVTSVNGQTGDVIVQPIVEEFIPNFPYKANNLITYDNGLYVAKTDFTSGASFNASDWEQVEASATTDWSSITGKPNFATVATSGLYTDLINTPNLAAVATSGSYADLSGAPNLATVATSGAYADLTGTPSLATVATSGLYSDLLGTPNLATVATTGNYSDLTGKPTLATVATSGDYNDLSNTPQLAQIALTGSGADLTNGTVSNTKMNYETTDIQEVFYSYTQEAASSTDVTLQIPIDFTTYKQIDVDMFYECQSVTAAWNYIQAYNTSNSLISCQQMGVEMNGSNTLTGQYRDINEVVAWRVESDWGVSVHLSIRAGNQTNWPIYLAQARGGTGAQWMGGRISTAPRLVDHLTVPFRVPKAGGWVRATGVRRENHT